MWFKKKNKTRLFHALLSVEYSVASRALIAIVSSIVLSSFSYKLFESVSISGETLTVNSIYFINDTANTNIITSKARVCRKKNLTVT